MKKVVFIALLVMLLCGCNARQTMETLGNVLQYQEAATPLDIHLELPGEPGIQTMHTEWGQIWFCHGYEITAETLPAGDISRTVMGISGYHKDTLTFLQTSAAGIARYECAWVSAGETGEEIHRAVILDDGSYHYVLTVCAAAEDAGSLQSTWEELLASFSVSG